uniref:Uncharacterized protein n=1 Tax=Cacopsylla melanoneura TaxID=428564 RepID=A0A8D9AMH8_9HEMI
MSKPLPLGQGNTRFNMFNGGRFPNPNSDHPPLVNNLGPVNSIPTNPYHPQHVPPPQLQQFYLRQHPVQPNNLQQSISMPNANTNNNNVQLNYQQSRPNNIQPNLQPTMVYPSPSYIVPGSGMYHQGNQVFFLHVNPNQYPPRYAPQQAPAAQQTTPIMQPTMSQHQPPMPSPQNITSLQASHMYAQPTNYGPPGPTSHQPPPVPAQQPPVQQSKQPPPQRTKKCIPILDPITKKNVMLDDISAEQQPSQPRESLQTPNVPHQVMILFE